MCGSIKSTLKLQPIGYRTNSIAALLPIIVQKAILNNQKKCLVTLDLSFLLCNFTVDMFTNSQRQEERTGKYGTPRVQYIQELVAQFQNATNEETKERIVANLANFAYDPYNYTFLRQLNVLELFLDCITEPNERLVEFGIGGICNACVDPSNAAVMVQCGGIPLVIQCLSSPVRNTVNYALGALYYLCNSSAKDEILKPEVVDVIKRYALASGVSVSFSNLAQAFLDKHVSELKAE